MIRKNEVMNDWSLPTEVTFNVLGDSPPAWSLVINSLPGPATPHEISSLECLIVEISRKCETEEYCVTALEYYPVKSYPAG